MSQTLFNNPILPGFYPDPSICKVENDYYMVTSTFSYFPGVPIFHSTDLIHWTQIGNILDRPEQIPLTDSDFAGGGIFAPTLRYHNGIFYMITTNVSTIGNFIVTATDPKGPWSDPYILGSEGIDPSLFFDDDGKCYYCGTKPRREGSKYFGDNEIYIQELDLSTMKLVGDSWAAWHGALREVEWPEGPHIYKKDGWYYLLISEAGTAHMHAVSIARSKTLQEPFEGYRGNPILTHRNLGLNYPIVNVGHPDIVETQNGEWWMVLLASRPYGDGYYRNLGRETFLVPFIWENGWPLINPGKCIVEETYTSPNLPTCKSPSLELQDDFNYSTLPLNYMYIRNPNLNNYSLTARPGFMRLTPSNEKISGTGSPTALCIRQLHFSYEVETKLEFNPNEHEAAGLVLLQSNAFNYQFSLTSHNNRKKLDIICCKKNGTAITESILASVYIDDCMADSPITLKAIQQLQSISFYYSFDGEFYNQIIDQVDARILCTDTAGGFVGTCLGIFATTDNETPVNDAYFDFLNYKEKN